MAKLYFYFSTMNAGKSTLLLQADYNYRERGMETILFTSSMDFRYGKGKITSRIGISSTGIPVETGTDMYSYVVDKLSTTSKIACVLVDEAQFLNKEHVRQLTKIVDKLKIPVLAYGLRSDYSGELFEGSMYLLAWADKLIELKTVCHCGRKAIMTMRVNKDGNKVVAGQKIEIGGNERYIATCRVHHTEGDPGFARTQVAEDQTLEPQLV